MPLTGSARVNGDVPVTDTAVAVALTGLQLVRPDTDLVTGMPVMIGDEIFKLISVVGDSVLLDRGCADTIPQAHASGDMVWFLNQGVGYPGVLHTATQTVGVKPAPFSPSTQVALDSIPPNEVTFNQRLYRPYPAGRLKVNGVPWFNAATINDGQPLALEWANRNRIAQGSTLVAHADLNQAAEAGLTYTLRFFASTNALVGEINGITGQSRTVTLGELTAMYGPGTKQGYFTFSAVRQGVESLQRYRTAITVESGGSSNPCGCEIEDTYDVVPTVFQSEPGGAEVALACFEAYMDVLPPAIAPMDCPTALGALQTYLGTTSSGGVIKEGTVLNLADIQVIMDSFTGPVGIVGMRFLLLIDGEFVDAGFIQVSSETGVENHLTIPTATFGSGAGQVMTIQCSVNSTTGDPTWHTVFPALDAVIVNDFPCLLCNLKPECPTP